MAPTRDSLGRCKYCSSCKGEVCMQVKGNPALCQIVLVEKTNKFSSNSSDFRWSYFVANKLLLIKILALK